MASTVPDDLRRAVEGVNGYDPAVVQAKLLLALVDVLARQAAAQERVADTFAELAKQD
jgi:hypothetical protein